MCGPQTRLQKLAVTVISCTFKNEPYESWKSQTLAKWDECWYFDNLINSLQIPYMLVISRFRGLTLYLHLILLRILRIKHLISFIYCSCLGDTSQVGLAFFLWFKQPLHRNDLNIWWWLCAVMNEKTQVMNRKFSWRRLLSSALAPRSVIASFCFVTADYLVTQSSEEGFEMRGWT